MLIFKTVPVNKGILPKEEASDIRLSGTCIVYAAFGEERNEELIERAERFVGEIESLPE